MSSNIDEKIERKRRRSSILKRSPSRTALTDVDINTAESTEYSQFSQIVQARLSKRVSFADTDQIKEFIRADCQDWHESSDGDVFKLNKLSNLLPPIPQRAPLPVPSSVVGLNNLLSAPIVDTKQTSEKLNETCGSCDMDMTNMSTHDEKNSDDEKKDDTYLGQYVALGKLGYTSFFDNTKLDIGEMYIPSSQEVVVETTSSLHVIPESSAKDNNVSINKENEGLKSKSEAFTVEVESSQSVGFHDFLHSIQENDVSNPKPLSQNLNFKDFIQSIKQPQQPSISSVPDTLKHMQDSKHPFPDDNRGEISGQKVKCFETDAIEPDGMDFTCVNPVAIAVECKNPGQGDDDLASKVDSTKEDVKSSDDVTRIFGQTDETMDFTECIKVQKTLLSENVRIAQNRTEDTVNTGDNFQQNNEDMDITCATNVLLLHTTVKNEKVQVTTDVGKLNKDSAAQVIQTTERKEASRTNFELDDITQHFQAGNDQMEETEMPLKIIRIQGGSITDGQSQINTDLPFDHTDGNDMSSIPQSIEYDHEEKKTPISDDRTQVFQTGNDEMDYTTTIHNEVIHHEQRKEREINLPEYAADDKTQHFGLGLGQMDLTEVIKTDKTIPIISEHHNKIVDAEVPDILVCDSQDSEYISSDDPYLNLGTRRENLDKESCKSSGIQAVSEEEIIIPSSQITPSVIDETVNDSHLHSNDEEEDSLHNISLLKRKISKVRSSIGVYKSRKQKADSQKLASVTEWNREEVELSKQGICESSKKVSITNQTFSEDGEKIAQKDIEEEKYDILGKFDDKSHQPAGKTADLKSELMGEMEVGFQHQDSQMKTDCNLQLSPESATVGYELLPSPSTVTELNREGVELSKQGIGERNKKVSITNQMFSEDDEKITQKDVCLASPNIKEEKDDILVQFDDKSHPPADKTDLKSDLVGEMEVGFQHQDVLMKPDWDLQLSPESATVGRDLLPSPSNYDVEISFSKQPLFDKDPVCNVAQVPQPISERTVEQIPQVNKDVPMAEADTDADCSPPKIPKICIEDPIIKDPSDQEKIDEIIQTSQLQQHSLSTTVRPPPSSLRRSFAESSILDDLTRLNQVENISVEDFLRDFANSRIRDAHLKKSRQSNIMPTQSSQPVKSMPELFSAVYLKPKELYVYENFMKSMEEKERWVQTKISKIEEELSTKNPEIFRKIRFGDSEESEVLVEKIQKLASRNKTLGKASWKFDASKLHKGLCQSMEEHISENLTPVADRLDKPQNLLESALTEIEEANRQLDELMKQYEEKEKPPSEEQAKEYEQDSEKLLLLEKQYEGSMSKKVSLKKDRTQFKQRQMDLLNAILNDEGNLERKNKEWNAIQRSLKSQQKYVPWCLEEVLDRSMEFSFLSQSLVLQVNSKERISIDNVVPITYSFKHQVTPDYIIPAELEMYKLFHKLMKDVVSEDYLNEKYSTSTLLPLALQQVSSLAYAIRDLMYEIDWISCQVASCSCQVSSDENCITVTFLPPMVGVDRFYVEFIFTPKDVTSGECANFLKEVQNSGFNPDTYKYIAGRRQLEHLGEDEVTKFLNEVEPGKQKLMRMVKHLMNKIK